MIPKHFIYLCPYCRQRLYEGLISTPKELELIIELGLQDHEAACRKWGQQ